MPAVLSFQDNWALPLAAVTTSLSSFCSGVGVVFSVGAGKVSAMLGIVVWQPAPRSKSPPVMAESSCLSIVLIKY